ncbi:LPS-assembly protein LptD [Paracidovorax avenae]|uniref:LPS-assembly protein LptD n=1 Tax=Paracidovorax avenae TaxID=80867 RepID=UPI000D15DB33|nr:LPS-assembly protein LptD [Paracidovorax avenae]AVT00700.1 LPS-assembly protein LptD [Paracidovorax avenae]AVT07656.1 LPS-assembly protein LptD [Paracidovorax avenae]AVT22203.1 LPS-assembly protein LptD [Paracidovorax avenae]
MDLSSLPDPLRPTHSRLPARRRNRAAPPRFEQRALARLAAWMVCGLPLAALAQTDPGPGAAAEPAPALRSSPLLQEKIPEDVRPKLPIFVRGDHVSGQPDINATVEGNAELRRGDTIIHADRLDYAVPDDLAKARGNVRINRAGNVYEGSLLELQVDAFSGFFDDASYRFLANGAYGDARRVDFIDRDRAVVHEATYTTCQKNDESTWKPAWIVRARSIKIDNAEQVGTAEGGVLEFQGVPVLPIPGSFTFPLSDKRKTGLLPPTVGIDSVSGVVYSQPYYWNIAPNRDATITPTVMSKRGVSTSGEFRYLEPTYSGEIRGDYMPSDRLRNRDRWALGLKHRGTFDTGIGGIGLNVDATRVSDDNYWRDFSTRTNGGISQLTQRLLPADASLSWGAYDMSLSMRTLKWQVLQDVNAPIVPPYDRMPQIHWGYTPSSLPGGFDASVEADYTDFRADRALTGQPNARRSYAMAQFSRPFLAPGGFITPRVQFHATQYDFDSALTATGQRTASRALPTFSLDSGLVFERDARYFGRNFVQTLEPRAFYTYTPYRDQSMIPVYDTAANDFNFATIYTENGYSGNDRIADNNLLTLGVTTRLLDPDDGGEAARFGIAQRLRFSDQNVVMPGETPVSERLSDVLLGAGINWTRQWGFDSTVQYNPKTGRSIRSTVGARYNPSDYRVINAAYRFQRGTSEQIDVGWQWPINDLWGDKGQNLGPGRGQGGGRWYSVGRLNYSLQDRKLVDTVIGFEYDSCCWIGRVVLERLQSSVTTATTRLLFQIEFVGFSRLSLGSDPIQTLKQNIPRYQYLREPVPAPSRFTNYD